MRNRSNTIVGFLFLGVGILWLVGIYLRSAEIPQSALTYQQVQENSQQFVEVVQEKMQAVSPAVEKSDLPRRYIYTFWAICIAELLSSLSLIIVGVSLLRGYRLAKRAMLIFVWIDIFLKASILYYHRFILEELSQVLEKSEVIFAIYTKGSGVIVELAKSFSGVELTSNKAVFFYVSYLLTWLFMIIYNPSSKEKLLK